MLNKIRVSLLYEFFYIQCKELTLSLNLKILKNTVSIAIYAVTWNISIHYMVLSLNMHNWLQRQLSDVKC